MKRIALSWIICVLGLVGLLVWLGPRAPRATTDSALVTADFTLATTGNKPVTDEDLRGKYLLVFFGFTHCPDICPTTLLLLTSTLEQMGDKARNIQPVFISVDPERDTPDLAAAYARNFGKNVLGLSGTQEQIKHVAESFKVYYNKVEDEGSALGYMVDHSGFIYLMGPDGEYLAHFAANIPQAELKKELLHYVR